MRVEGLRCKECGELYETKVKNTCEKCFGPLEISYNYEEIKKEEIEKGPRSIWRYKKLLPVNQDRSLVDLGTGFNPLHKADNLAEKLGIDELYILNDSVNPSFSFKDRVTAVAVSKALEFDLEAVGCASTGNLASSVAAHAAKAGLPAYILIPDSIEEEKITQTLAYDPEVVRIDGTYDEVNRLATELAQERGWGFVNINLRPYYTEGSCTMAYETAEQLGWQSPDHVVHPMAAGASLVSVWNGYQNLEKTGLIDDGDIKISGAQPRDFPIVRAVRENTDIKPVKNPKTIAHSLAIGDPADGLYAKEIIQKSGGNAANPRDKKIIEGIKLLARTEGIFTEPAGGTSVAGLKQLVEEGTIQKDETVVLNITGNGLKAKKTLDGELKTAKTVENNLKILKKVA